MPSFYAHDRFGAIAARQLKKDLREIIAGHGRQYAIGLQGPDLFFYYRPWGENPVNSYGVHLHKVSAYPFFNRALGVVRAHGRDSAAYAYLLGFIGHFILDSECHPYVDEMIEKTGVGHLEIESEFEKLLLRRDGRDPLAYPVYELIPTDQETAEAAALFFNRAITPEIIRRSLKEFKMVKRLFVRPSAAGQAAIHTIMKALGKYDTMKGLMNQRTDNPACRESNEGLLQRFDRAVGLAAQMMEDFDSVLCSGGRLDSRFDRTFE